MQQIERYGVIALVFLLVTIVAVSFWGDSKSPGFWSRLTGRAKKAEIAQIEPLPAPVGTEAPVEGALDGLVPLNPDASNAFLADATTPRLDSGAGLTPAAGTPTTPATGSPTITDFASGGQAPLPYLAPMPAPIVAPAGPEYVVVKDDSLGSIARRTLGSASRWPEIQALNGGIEPKSLRVGMKLVLPATANLARTTPEAKPAAAKKPAAKEAPKGPSATYVVQKGDSLSSIAAKKLGEADRWKEILAMNPGMDPQKLAAGKSIRIPIRKAGALVAAATPSSSASMQKPRVR